ncbi:MAG: hypothetical protein ABL997_08585 [Planctomycetota bacterium]
MTQPDAIAAATSLARSFEQFQVRYVLGGSMASTSYGEPRSTLDADFAADLNLSHFEAWADEVEKDFLFDREWARAEVASRGSFQLLHRTSLVRVDVFVPAWTGLDLWKWEQRKRLVLGAGGQAIDVTSAEGIVLQKLRWYEAGGRSSDRQWRDVVGVLSQQRSRLDRPALAQWAKQLQLESLLQRALRDAGL